MSMNQVILVGRLGNDPDTRVSPKGVAVATFTVATVEFARNGVNQSETRTEWHRVVVFGQSAEAAVKYLKKGTRIGVVGKIKTQQYEDKQGAQRHVTEVITEKLIFLEKKVHTNHNDNPESSAETPHDQEST